MRTSSTTSLHSHIRKLQRQLETKTDEAAQLRRQVEAQKDTDVGTLSEQLREAKREAQQWKERAEAAERRVKVFERFTARLRGIREAAAAADERGDTMTTSNNIINGQGGCGRADSDDEDSGESRLCDSDGRLDN